MSDSLDSKQDWMAEDISKLLVTGLRSDIVAITVGWETFTVHKAILTARSPIFANLLKTNCKENRLEISDVAVDVFEILLCFIYTGKVPALETQMAQDILTAAGKYQLEQLKLIVEDYLCDQLSLESVARFLSLAEAANASKLKDKCLELLNSTAPPSHPVRLSPLARLPDLCLIALFQQLPPIDQLSARNVCHRWSDLVPTANRQQARSLVLLFNQSLDECEDKFNSLSHGRDWKLLKLLHKDDGTPLIPMYSLSQWNSLLFSTLDKETVSLVATTFPVVKSLQLFGSSIAPDSEGLHCDCCTTHTPTPDLLVRLLEQWRPQLSTLKLSVYFWCRPESLLAPSISRLCDTINSLSTLKHLTFDLTFNDRRLLPHLPRLSQLCEFNTNSNLTELVDMLHRCDPASSALTRISHEGWSYDEIDLAKLTSLSEHLRHSFVRIQSFELHRNLTICSHFRSLTSIEHSFNLTTMHDDFRRLSQLTALVQLSLRLYYIPVQEPPPLLAQLHSVKLLHLNIQYGHNHSILEALNLRWTMPNVQVVQFSLSEFHCFDCRFYSTKTNLVKEKRCIRHLFSSLKRDCNKLRIIKHDLEHRLGTAEELLAEPIPEEQPDQHKTVRGNNVTSRPQNRRRRASRVDQHHQEEASMNDNGASLDGPSADAQRPRRSTRTRTATRRYGQD